MICLLCLKAETPSEDDQACVECMETLQYAEDFIKDTGFGIKVMFHRVAPPISMERGDLSVFPTETTNWSVEVTPQPDPDGTKDQPVYEGSGDTLKEACDMAHDKLKEDLE